MRQVSDLAMAGAEHLTKGSLRTYVEPLSAVAGAARSRPEARSHLKTGKKQAAGRGDSGAETCARGGGGRHRNGLILSIQEVLFGIPEYCPN